MSLDRSLADGPGAAASGGAGGDAGGLPEPPLPPIDHSGFLMKQGGRVKTWHLRWFQLHTDNKLR